MDTEEPGRQADGFTDIKSEPNPAHDALGAATAALNAAQGSPSRKRHGDYSENPHSKKSRMRLAAMTDHERWLHQKKNADGVAAMRARRKVENSARYAQATSPERLLMLGEAESDCTRKR